MGDVFDFAVIEQLVADGSDDRDVLIDGIVEYMNSFFCVIKGTSCTIIERTVDEDEDGNVFPDLVFRTTTGFRHAFLNKTIVVKTLQTHTTARATKITHSEETICLYEMWMKHRNRREYDKMAFRERVPRNTFNVFLGFKFHPKPPGSAVDSKVVAPWLGHIKRIWCRGDENIYDYVIKYFAHLIQKPFVKTKIAFVLRSKQGAGKGHVMEKIAQIFGQYFKTAKTREFTGEFNAVLIDTLILFLDECVYSGDKKLAAYLKSLITEKKHQINMKGLPPVTVDNRINVFMATNEAWCAPVEEKDRRYFILELDEKYAGKTTKESFAYFQKIIDVPAEAIYHYLMSIDLSDFTPLIFPTTSASREQKIYTMESVPAWAYYIATDGSINEENDAPYNIEDEASTYPKKNVYASYRSFCDSYGYRRSNYFAFFEILGKIIQLDTNEDRISLPDKATLKEALNTYMGENVL